MSGSPEQRRHQRIPAQSGDVMHPEFVCLDISESGARFKVERKQRAGTNFMVEIQTLRETFAVKCVIVWCQEPASIFEDGFHAGVKFEGLSIRHQLQLREMINERL